MLLSHCFLSDNLVIADVSVTDDVERVEELTEDVDGIEEPDGDEPDGDEPGGEEEQHGQVVNCKASEQR